MDAVIKTDAKPRRTKRRGRHPDKALSAAFIRSAPPGRHADGNGMYLFVQPAGTRSWIQRLVIRGRRRELGLGAAALVSLAEARELALANRKLARSGGDPLADKRRAEGVPTFADAARRVVEQKQGGWRGRWRAQNWLRSLERYAFPRIGERPVSEVNSADVLEILTPIWHVKAETARAVRQRIRSVLEWAIAMELRADNPCDRVLPVLGPQNDIVQHRRALPHKDVAAAIETVRASASVAPAIKLAFEFLVLTAARSGEVRLATWDEIDTAGQVWTIPAMRMKAKREHRVPLCRRAAEILEAARTLGDGKSLVFPMRSGRPISMRRGSSPRWRTASGRRARGPEQGRGDLRAVGRFPMRSGRPISMSTLPKMLQYLGIAAVAHGFRSSFRDWAAEETDHPREVIEAALAHVVQNKVEATYARSDLFERRRRVMNDWAAYLNGQRGSDNQPRP